MATHLARTCDATSASGYSNKWTWSGWVKRAKLGAEQGIMGNKRDDNNTNSRFKLYFRSTDKLGWECKDSGGSDDNSFETNMLFRDTNAWYHIVFIYDSDNSTETDRMKCYVNGKDVRTELGGFSSVNEVGSGFGTLWSSAVANYLGTSGNNSGIAMQFEGCMSHCHLTYGYRYEASTFGSFDSTTGEWKINTSPSVTYGSQGYFLLKDNASVTDQSGEGNNYTATGTLTKTEDNPSNNFATGNRLIGRHSNGNYIQPDWSNANLTATADGSAWRIFKSTLAASSGKYYAEFKWVSDSNTRYAYVGIYDEDDYVRKASGYPYLNDMANGHAYYSENGNYYTNNTNTSFGSAFSSTGDGIVGVAMDLDNSKVYWSSNGSWQGGGDPSNGTGGKSITANKLYSFGLSLYSVGSIVYSANFGNGFFGTTAVSSAGTNASNNGIFEYDVPTGFTALSTKGLNT